MTKMGGEVLGVTSPGPCGSLEMVARHHSGTVSVVICRGVPGCFPFFRAVIDSL